MAPTSVLPSPLQPKSPVSNTVWFVVFVFYYANLGGALALKKGDIIYNFLGLRAVNWNTVIYSFYKISQYGTTFCKCIDGFFLSRGKNLCSFMLLSDSSPDQPATCFRLYTIDYDMLLCIITKK